MAGALARGDVDAYVGAEPAGGISLANGTGVLVEYPYSTPIGPLNMILSASQKAVKENPERIKLVVDMHKKAVDHAMANQPQIVDMAVAEARPAEEVGGACGAERRTGVEDRRRLHDARQGLRADHVREQAIASADRPRQVRHPAIPVESASIEDRLERTGHGASGSHTTGRTGSASRRARAPSACSTRCARSRSAPDFPFSWWCCGTSRSLMTGTRLVPSPHQVAVMMYDFSVRRHLRRRFQPDHPHPHLEVDDTGLWRLLPCRDHRHPARPDDRPS